jgi:hypothetical protein
MDVLALSGSSLLEAGENKLDRSCRFGFFRSQVLPDLQGVHDIFPALWLQEFLF